MNDFTLDELNVLVDVFNRAGLATTETQANALFDRVKVAQSEREELESMDFDDCAGGACKL
ncbi:hypothetical protein Q4583_07345 [Neptunomonas phycophila]|jgi:hypothetical protein|uniref:hypothetical protein n=1 Tax=Neptunomonas phycophila TaxID=1572645 RepID=UPI001BE75010|nr:hypothetical protein [Neptunomonas phycophila]MBT3144730.1 hypothetical protein [Neptunomonas phycophila]MDO6467879.1 hypothetical protein [Neptunomonas phycophila]MDO6783923.1 hypothetical protein [Neptunomonas phycophila]